MPQSQEPGRNHTPGDRLDLGERFLLFYPQLLALSFFFFVWQVPHFCLFTQQVKRESERGVFLEYAWDMNWCDPCAANSLSAEELRGLGVFWQDNAGRTGKGFMGQAHNVFLTRLYVRYDAAHFPENLTFQETSDRSNFQARYILRHPWTGTDECPAATAYRQQLRERYEKEAQTLATLTGWNIGEIRKQMNIATLAVGDEKKWYQRLWNN